jgi:hypothetical protein
MACLREHAGARPGLLGVWRIFCGCCDYGMGRVGDPGSAPAISSGEIARA